MKSKTLALILNLCFVFSGASALAGEATRLAPVCVVSFIPQEEVNLQIKEDALQLLEKMGYSRQQPRFDFFANSIKNLRECLQGPYEDVIIIAHSMEMIEGHTTLIYPDKAADGTPVWMPLSWRVFDRLDIKPTLRQITFVACETEKILANYGILANLAKRHNLYIKSQPFSPLASLFYGGKKVRAQNLFSGIIAEAAQDENAKDIFCVLRTSVYLIYESGSTHCLRNHFRVGFQGGAIGLKTTTRFAKLRVDSDSSNEMQGQIGFFDLEAGLLRGVELSASRDPGQLNNETYGFSFSLMNYYSIERIHDREFGIDNDDNKDSGPPETPPENG